MTDSKVAFRLTQNLDQDAELSFGVAQGEFPKIDQLMADTEVPAEDMEARLQREAERAKATGRTPAEADVWERRYLFNPDFMALFCKVSTEDRNGYLDFRFTATGKPAVVHIGERFRALIVPVKAS